MARLLPLSKGCQHAVRTVALLSLEPSRKIFARQELSRKTGVSTAFLSKILQTLARANILRSHRGAHRGYSLARTAAQISILNIVTAYDGPIGHDGCLLDDYKLCPKGKNVCAVHRHRLKIQNELIRTLHSVKVAEVAKTLSRRHAAKAG